MLSGCKYQVSASEVKEKKDEGGEKGAIIQWIKIGRKEHLSQHLS